LIGDAFPGQKITQGQRIHDGCQHAHPVAHHTIHARFGKGRTTEQVAPAKYHTKLNAGVNRTLYLSAKMPQYRRIDTLAGVAT
jgi:hypothetical protein